MIGHSMGGTIGMMLAARHPDTVSKLMVVDMMPFLGAMFGGPGATPETLKPLAESMRTSMLNAPVEAHTKELEATIAAYVRTETMRPVALEDANRSDRDVASRAYAELIVTDLRPELSNIRAKSSIIYVTPTNAPITDAKLDAYMQAAYANLKGATLRRAPNAAHFVMWDNGPWFHAEVKSFFAD
ncbi:MAG TPA: alpha/beta hydrolase [Sphingorhabdus sp.]|nr:alpha/beta hydrolase [Sphingorhabdus sp.]